MPATQQYEATRGYGELSEGTRYHCLRNDAKQGRVFLVRFFKERPGVSLHVLSSSGFEQALADGALKACAVPIFSPPWLSELEGMNFDLLDSQRPRAQRFHRDLVEKRLAVIKPAMEHLHEIFIHADPDKALNRYARLATPKQNEKRFRLSFYTYLAFNDIWSLFPDVSKNGRWSRERNAVQKQGRHHKDKEVPPGFNCTQAVVDQIQKGYRRYARPQRTLLQVYQLTMEKTFGCKTIQDERGDERYVHPQGKPFPSLNQFRYWSDKHIGKEQRQRTALSDQRYRNSIQSNQGAYSESVANLMEKMEGDAYSTLEHPRGFLADHVSPKLFVVRLVCVTSGMIVGIGFSHGSETATAYLAALYCASIDKVKFCADMGIKIAREEWPSIGLSPVYIPDRGPGSSEEIVAKLEEIVSIAEAPPSHTPQSHGSVEAHHPKDIHLQGAPTYRVSKFDPVEMARAAVHTAIQHNKTASASERMTVDMRRHRVMPTPLGIWKYLANRGRSDAQQLSQTDAVKRFLTPVQFDLVNGKLMLRKLTYRSSKFQAALSAIGYRQSSPSVRLNGFTSEMCVRTSWVEVAGRLIEVEAQLPIRDDAGQLWLSLTDLSDYEASVREGRRRLDRHRPAAGSSMAERATDSIGADPRDVNTRQGRAEAKTVAARREIKHMRPGDHGGRR